MRAKLRMSEKKTNDMNDETFAYPVPFFSFILLALGKVTNALS